MDRASPLVLNRSIRRAACACAALLLTLALVAGCGGNQRPAYTRPEPTVVFVDLERLVYEHPLLVGLRRPAALAANLTFEPRQPGEEEVLLAYSPLAALPAPVSCPTAERALAEARQLHGQFEAAVGNWLLTAEQLMSRELEEATYPFLVDLDYRAALARQQRLQELLSENRQRLVSLALGGQQSKVPAESAEYWRQYDELLESIIARADEAATTTRAQAVFSAQLQAQESVRGLQEEFQERELALVEEADALKARLEELATQSGETVEGLCETYETYSVPSREGETRRISARAALPGGPFELGAIPTAAVRARALRETQQLVQQLCRAKGVSSYTDAQSRSSLPDATEELLPLVRRFWAGELEVERPASG